MLQKSAYLYTTLEQGGILTTTTESNLSSSELDKAFRARMAEIVLKESRPFCYLNFLEFEVNGKWYKMTHGIFRNKISKLMRNGEVHLICYSPQGFYSLKGVDFLDCKQVWTKENNISNFLDEQELKYFKNKPIYRELSSLPFGEWGLHNIHLKFQCDGLWNLLRSSEKYVCDDHSQDITITTSRINNLAIIARIHHRRDTVTVVIGCSYDQIILDTDGVERLNNALAILESEIMLAIDRISNEAYHKCQLVAVPPYYSWIVTLWHFANDGTNYYSGEKFFCNWKFGKRILISIYSKCWPEGKYRIRMEIQEHPKIALSNALHEKLQKIKSSR